MKSNTVGECIHDWSLFCGSLRRKCFSQEGLYRTLGFPEGHLKLKANGGKLKGGVHEKCKSSVISPPQSFDLVLSKREKDYKQVERLSIVLRKSSPVPMPLRDSHLWRETALPMMK